MPQPASKSPLTIAHRGGADLWPENTLPAFARAIYMGVDGIEFDMQLSRDGHIVIHHDATLKPAATRLNGNYLTAPTPRLDALSYQELMAYDIGRLDPKSAYGKRRRAGEADGQMPIDDLSIPHLSVLERLVELEAPKGFRLYAELKTDMTPDPAQAHKLTDAYLAALESSPVAKAHCAVSFDWRCLNRLRKARPDMAHAYTTLPFSQTDPAHESASNETPNSEAALIRAASAAGAPWWDGFDWRMQKGDSHGEKVLRAIHAAGGTGWFAFWRDINADTMALADELGLRVSAWTVNDAANMQMLAELGVEALITDRPDIMTEIFKKP